MIRNIREDDAAGRPVRFSDGTHMVGLYTMEDSILSAVVPFFAAGLRGNDRCFYGASPETIARVRTALAEEGIDVAAAEDSGQLVLLGRKEPMLKDGRFDPAHLVELYRSDIEAALAAGWSHVRATAEMSWLIEGTPGREEILYYEALSTELFNKTEKVHALCQYRTDRMSGAEIVELLKIHPWALFEGRIGENPFWIDPEPEVYRPSRAN
ncbi:MAG: MEDS domain-containing protein [Candidatus Erginobacter occultus]|nr:MEDS domain-containing protein [Candidatus Erginobacter occultus]